MANDRAPTRNAFIGLLNMSDPFYEKPTPKFSLRGWVTYSTTKTNLWWPSWKCSANISDIFFRVLSGIPELPESKHSSKYLSCKPCSLIELDSSPMKHTGNISPDGATLTTEVRNLMSAEVASLMIFSMPVRSCSIPSRFCSLVTGNLPF